LLASASTHIAEPLNSNSTGETARKNLSHPYRANPKLELSENFTHIEILLGKFQSFWDFLAYFSQNSCL